MITLDARRKLDTKIQELEKELKQDLPRELNQAAALGDLRENAEYQSARERQDYLRARLAQLRQRLLQLSMIDVDKIPQDRISLGSTVVVWDIDRNEELTYKLVTVEDANAAEGLISTSSPIGRSFLGKRTGDTVNVRIPSGTRSFEVLRFTTIHDRIDA